MKKIINKKSFNSLFIKNLFDTSIIRLSLTKIEAYGDVIISMWNSRGLQNKLYFDVYLPSIIFNNIKNNNYMVNIYLTGSKRNKIYQINYNTNSYTIKDDGLDDVCFYKIETPVPELSGVEHITFRIEMELIDRHMNAIHIISKFKIELYTRESPVSRVKHPSFYELLQLGINVINKRYNKSNKLSKKKYIQLKHDNCTDNLCKYYRILQYFCYLSYLRDTNSQYLFKLDNDISNGKLSVLNINMIHVNNYNFIKNPWYIFVYLKRKYNHEFNSVFGKDFSFRNEPVFPLINDVLHGIDIYYSDNEDKFKEYDDLSCCDMIKILSDEIGFLYTFEQFYYSCLVKVVLFLSKVIMSERNKHNETLKNSMIVKDNISENDTYQENRIV